MKHRTNRYRIPYQDARELDYRWVRDLKLLKLRRAYFQEQ